MKAVFSLALLTEIASAKKADEIPRVRTPEPGDWPQDGVTGCGILGLPPIDMLDECTEPLHEDAPDLRGFWKTPEGHIDEFIAMCGMRWIDVSSSVIHDHPKCDGTLEGGVEDYSGPEIARAELKEFNDDIKCRGLCASIRTAGKFETDENGNKCVNLYTDTLGFGFLSKVVSRCLDKNDPTKMVWVHPVVGTVHYTKVPAGEEPNCMKCPDGSIANETSQRLGCGYEERKWERCTNADIEELANAPKPEQVDTCSRTSEPINGPLYLGIAVVVLVLCCVVCCFAATRRSGAAAEGAGDVELVQEES